LGVLFPFNSMFKTFSILYLCDLLLIFINFYCIIFKLSFHVSNSLTTGWTFCTIFTVTMLKSGCRLSPVLY
jgi:hypothetical protein